MVGAYAYIPDQSRVAFQELASHFGGKGGWRERAHHYWAVSAALAD